MEKLAGEVSFLRARFSFPRSNGPFSRSDSCQNRAKRDFGSPDREKGPFDRGNENLARRKEKAQEFYFRRRKFIPEAKIYFLCCLHTMTLPLDLELSLGPRNHAQSGIH